MDLRTLAWDDELLAIFGIPRAMLPADPLIVGRAGYGVHAPDRSGRRRSAGLRRPGRSASGHRRTGVLSRRAKPRTPTAPAISCCSTPAARSFPRTRGLLTTVCYQMGEAPPIYALEGSIAVTGSAVQWLRDQLGIISAAAEIEALAPSVPDNGGIYFVPAFSGLFAPHWRSDARGAIVGLSRFNTRAHLARATLEAICFQTRARARCDGEGFRRSPGDPESRRRRHGQQRADAVAGGYPRSAGRPPVVAETTALGAAYAAGLATGFWRDLDDLRQNWKMDRQWDPQWSADQRDAAYAGWEKAVQRTLDWI